MTGGRGTAGRVGRRRSGRGARRQRQVVVGVLLVIVVVVAGIVLYGVRSFIAARQVPDYPGPGGAELVVQVEPGENLSEIGARLTQQDVVASVRAFTRAAQEDPRIQRVQPGYYQVREQMSGAGAVARMLEPQARVGRLEIRGGEQLDDVELPNGSTVAGLLSELAKASCATVRGASTCVSAEDLRAAMAATDPVELGVPRWAADPMGRVDPERKLEGILLPGTYDVRPGGTAVDLLREITTGSMAKLLTSGLPDAAAGTGYSPYELLVIASVIEREGITPDFGKVSRVIYNRLAEGMPLQMDSTINYPLDRQQVRTNAADRARPGPYNTYLNKGLPISPIGAPSTAAVEAAARPEDGPWRYFVKCQRDGTSCFSVTIEQHGAAVQDAVARGVF